MFPFKIPRLFYKRLNGEHVGVVYVMCTRIMGRVLTPYNQLNADVQHDSCTRR